MTDKLIRFKSITTKTKKVNKRWMRVEMGGGAGYQGVKWSWDTESTR